jgi:hypothetical protein
MVRTIVKSVMRELSSWNYIYHTTLNGIAVSHDKCYSEVYIINCNFIWFQSTHPDKRREKIRYLWPLATLETLFLPSSSNLKFVYFRLQNLSLKEKKYR